MAIKFFVADEFPKFQFTVKDENDTVVNLTTEGVTSAKCHIRKEGDVANKFSGAAEDCTIPDPINGRIDYALPVNGINTAGSYTAQLELIKAAGNQHTDRFQFNVEDRLA